MQDVHAREDVSIRTVCVLDVEPTESRVRLRELRGLELAIPRLRLRDPQDVPRQVHGVEDASRVHPTRGWAVVPLRQNVEDPASVPYLHVRSYISLLFLPLCVKKSRPRAAPLRCITVQSALRAALLQPYPR